MPTTTPTDSLEDHAEQRPVWAWIDQSALRHNARRARALAGDRSVIGVVKADGYGHGAAVAAQALLAEGVARLAVVSVAEGSDLRRSGIGAPILLLGGLDEDGAAERALKWGLTPVLHDLAGLARAAQAGRREAPVTVEIEIDTGMRRMGVTADSALDLLAAVAAEPGVVLGGVFTHLARADESDPKACREQVTTLIEVLDAAAQDPRTVSAVRSAGVHIVNSGGLLRLSEVEEDLGEWATTAVRPGLMLYGVSPIAGVSAEALDLEPAMTLAARVISVRRIAAGDRVGYGGEWTASVPTTIATLPLGYADGIPRAVLGRGSVHLGGKSRPIVGRVSMDSVCVDVGDAEVEVGDLATVFGRTPEGLRVPVEDFAAAAGTIGYEILVGVGARVPRWIGSGWPPGETPREDTSGN